MKDSDADSRKDARKISKRRASQVENGTLNEVFVQNVGYVGCSVISKNREILQR
jgi:hypothetical protein